MKKFIFILVFSMLFSMCSVDRGEVAITEETSTSTTLSVEQLERLELEASSCEALKNWITYFGGETELRDIHTSIEELWDTSGRYKFSISRFNNPMRELQEEVVGIESIFLNQEFTLGYSDQKIFDLYIDTFENLKSSIDWLIEGSKTKTESHINFGVKYYSDAEDALDKIKNSSLSC